MTTSQLSRTPRSLADDLRSRTPGQIRRLLALRPDLLTPWPTDISQLARRAADDASVLEAMGSVSTPCLRVLEVFAALHEAELDVIRAGLSDEAVEDAVADLWERGLLWGGPIYKIVRAAQQAFGPYPCGLSAASHLGPDPVAVRRDAQGLDPDRLRYLVWEHPVSTTANPLTVVRGEQYIVAREVSLILRDGQFLQPASVPAVPEPVLTSPLMWSALAGVRYTITELQREPLAWHPQRGVSRRVVQDRAASMSVPLEDLAAWLELSATAGLVGGSGSLAMPTADGLAWLSAEPQQMWQALVRAWLPSDRPLPRCHPDDLGCLTTSGIARTALHRQHILSALPAAPLDAPELSTWLAWKLPRMVQAREQLPEFLAELTTLGLLSAGVPCADLLHVADMVVPACDNGLIIQPDHTVIAPANVDTATWMLLHDIARVESWGPVSVLRIEAARLRLALAVRTPDEVLRQLTSASRTPLPQSLEYTIRDASRGRPVQIRRETVIRGVGEDSEALRELGWQELGPGIFGTAQPQEVVRKALAELGIAVITDDRGHTAAALDYPCEPAHEELAVDRLVEHLVQPASAAPDPPPLDPAEPGTLREALSARLVWLEFSDGQATLTHLVEPLELRSGSLTGWSLTASRSVSIPLSRIAALRIVDD